MGHVRLGSLPQTRSWTRLVALIGDRNTDTASIAGATLKAAERAWATGPNDAALIHSFWLLTQLPMCARAEDFAQALQKLGVGVSADPGLMEIVGAFSDAVDTHIRRGGKRTDLGEMAQMGAAETLTATLAAGSESLFGTTPGDVRRALSRLATTKRFSILARDFFSRLIERYLQYFLSRELSNHVGKGRRFEDIGGHDEFSAALALHSREASKIVEKFAGDWFSKTKFEGGITPEKAAGFLGVAMKKVRDELRQRV